MTRKKIVTAVAESVTGAVVTTIEALAHPVKTATHAQAAAGSAIVKARHAATKVARRAVGKNQARKKPVKKAARTLASPAKPAVRKAAKKAANRRKHR